MEKGKYIKTIYGRKWESNKNKDKENLFIVICGLMLVIIFLLFN